MFWASILMLRGKKVKNVISFLKDHLSKFKEGLPQEYIGLLETDISIVDGVLVIDNTLSETEKHIFLAGHLQAVKTVISSLEPPVEIAPTEVAPRYFKALEVVAANNIEAWNAFPEKIRVFLTRYKLVEIENDLPKLTKAGLDAIEASIVPSKVLTENQKACLQFAMDHDIENWAPPGHGRAVGASLRDGYVSIKHGYPILTDKGNRLAAEYRIKRTDRYSELPEEIASAEAVNVHKRIVWTKNQKLAFEAALDPDKTVWQTIKKLTRESMIRAEWVNVEGNPTQLGIAMASMNGMKQMIQSETSKEETNETLPA